MVVGGFVSLFTPACTKDNTRPSAKSARNKTRTLRFDCLWLSQRSPKCVSHSYKAVVGGENGYVLS